MAVMLPKGILVKVSVRGQKVPSFCQKFAFRNLKKGVQDFHRKIVLTPADKAANNIVVV